MECISFLYDAFYKHWHLVEFNSNRLIPWEFSISFCELNILCLGMAIRFYYLALKNWCVVIDFWIFIKIHLRRIRSSRFVSMKPIHVSIASSATILGINAYELNRFSFCPVTCFTCISFECQNNRMN